MSEKFNSLTGLYDRRFEHDSCGVGFVANVYGQRSHQIVSGALTILTNMSHRGARGAEENSGDGAGILTQLPHHFFKLECEKLHIVLPEQGEYAVGMLFLPVDDERRAFCERLLVETIENEGQVFLGWRDVPVNGGELGDSALRSKPVIRQIFIAKGENKGNRDQFERKLFVIRRWAKELLTRADAQLAEQFYFASLSTRTIVYKGMLTPEQLESFYPDLQSADFESALALVHSRFSTNTFPNWNRAQPLRYIAHNGEINTLRGNVSWMRARESKMRSELFGDDLQKVFHVIDDDASDSGAFDNSLEFFSLAGRDLPHVAMMMIPEPLFEGSQMSDAKRAFYEYHACLTEPWDGPASITFTDGEIIGGLLDRNGLRPSRYYVTSDGCVVAASEVGVLEVDPSKVIEKGRLQPGKMFLVDTKQGRILSDEEIKEKYASQHPYRQWLDENMLHIDDLPEPPFVHLPDHSSVLQRQRAFGFTDEELRMIIVPMAASGGEPIGSMGDDTPLAVLSKKPQLLYRYFKQLFAQVTNPPIDAIREELVTSTDTNIGPEENLLKPSPKCARQIKLNSFILNNSELEKLRLLGDSEGKFGQSGFRSITLPMLFDREHGAQGLEWALDTLCHQASRAIADGYDILILSDRQMNEYRVPISALLAVSAIHHHLIAEGTRTQVGFVLESGEPREVHHFALLLGYGATAINPYLAVETVQDQVLQDVIQIGPETAIANYTKAVNKGVVKILSKMGISTIQSYLGAQVFEAIGVSEHVINRYFTGTPTRIGGIGLDKIAEDALQRHEAAFFANSDPEMLGLGGSYQWRASGESHQLNPRTIHLLQRACRNGDFTLFREYSRLVDEQSRNGLTLRGLLEFKNGGEGVPIEEVESAEEILKRFKTGAISYGSISREAHETLAIAMNRIGGKSNTGEGGEDAERYIPLPNGDNRRSKIKQIASGRFGVTSHYLVNADEIQIKIAQGAKPGEGGQLPGSKVYPWIAKTRFSTPGVGLISPPPHHDIYSIEDLAQLIFDLKNANDRARVSVKLVAEAGVGTVAAGVAKAKADVILISGHDGGTGASPLSSIKNAGIPWEIGLSETHQTLVLNGLRDRVRLETDGQLKTGRDVVIAGLLGADEFGFSTAPLVALGCVMMRACHLNTCPVGVATQDPRLREKFSGKPEHIENFMRFVAEEVRQIMAGLGIRTFDEMVGRTDVLEQRDEGSIDLSKVLFRPENRKDIINTAHSTTHVIKSSFDLLEICKNAIDRGLPISAILPIRNTDRAVGTKLGASISRKYGAAGLPDDTIRLGFLGSAGQSFAAFVPKGVTMTLEGDANDYIGKGLSGGKIVVFPPASSKFASHENVIIGNTALYGATSGRAFISGISGERFAVRNSGAIAVIEGVGDHACEYMTGGRVVVLGGTGKNFAAGMSGGIAYIFNSQGNFAGLCNQEMVDLTEIDDQAERSLVHELVSCHFELTGSKLASRLLENWDANLNRFVRVIPRDYRRVLEEQMSMERREDIGPISSRLEEAIVV